ncbi:C40 family peptidase [Streptomyces physcomitrii]|uniref:Glycoside hydrolase n=1 Tax=Streptomyces physcomitrii TaxID=2724184 RepID=A0ABX1GZR7_9ACTN|nr:C40 family peptidase [Streptomyces physcomitrii]NKI40559.1 glycoside hydrolase [Streptomyces physcomitrii]
MASHRKPRSPRVVPGPAVGLTTAALTSVALLSGSATAAPEKPGPSLEEVRKKVDGLYHEAGVATQKYNAAKERSDAQRRKVDGLLDDVARRTEKLNEARAELGSFAAAQYRTGGVSGTATLLLADDPAQYFDQTQLMHRLTGRQKKAVDDYQSQQLSTARKRAEATRSLAKLTGSRRSLKSAKQDVQAKLGSARALLSQLTAEEKARLAAIEKKKEEEARRKAAALARKQAEERERREREDDEGGTGEGGTGGGEETPDTPGGASAAQGEQALAFARQQIGKPYVWGASGPDSFDCSGLTLAAWKAAGITLPRTTWDQVKTGTTIPVSEARPGDLVFFYDDISHVGLYLGDGMMVHAPKPGASVREESISYMPIHSVVRPG